MIDFSSLEKKKEVKRKNSFLYLQDMAFLQSKCVVSFTWKVWRINLMFCVLATIHKRLTV